VTALLKLVEGLNVTEAVQMLYGFENMIKGKIKHNMQKVTIDELKIELL
jgi:NifU-like protein involved in Fe-S cluster formation